MESKADTMCRHHCPRDLCVECRTPPRRDDPSKMRGADSTRRLELIKMIYDLKLELWRLHTDAFDSEPNPRSILQEHVARVERELNYLYE